MRTEELIVQLAGSAGPVRPLSPPLVRLARWMAMAIPLAALGVVAIGPRADILDAVRQPTFIWLAAATFLTAVSAAACAFALSVPGIERSPAQRMVPLVAASGWAFILIALLRTGGAPLQRVLALPIHGACIAEIAGLGLLPGLVLFSMLRRAAPLRLAWTATLAALAAVALSAVATQIICPIDDPAHQLVGHLVPVGLLTAWAAVAGRSRLDWLRGR